MAQWDNFGRNGNKDQSEFGASMEMAASKIVHSSNSQDQGLRTGCYQISIKSTTARAIIDGAMGQYWKQY